MWEALDSHQEQLSSELNDVVRRTSQESPLLAAGPGEGWTQHGQREKFQTTSWETMRSESHLQISLNSVCVLCQKHDGLPYLGNWQSDIHCVARPNDPGLLTEQSAFSAFRGSLPPAPGVLLYVQLPSVW